jgi:hypothetical protein
VELYHPTFLYAYAALILQCGVVQTIGCLGAQRLSHKLLSAYWILLLLLTIGDVVVGLVWVFKLDRVKLNLRPVLTREFISKYSTDESFTHTWNKVQSEEHCCGVDGPLDYDKLSQVVSQQYSKNNPNSSLVIDVESSLLSLPESCCIVLYDSLPVSGGSSSRDSIDPTYRSSHHSHEKELTSPSPPSSNGSDFENNDGSGSRDNRRRTSPVSDQVPHGPPSVPWDTDGSGGGSAEFMLNDQPYSNPSQISNQLTDSSGSLEYLSSSIDDISLSSRSHSGHSARSIGKTISKSNQDLYSHGSESSEELSPQPLASSLTKHKGRHGHRLKQLASLRSNSSNPDELGSSSFLDGNTGLPSPPLESFIPDEENSADTKNASNEQKRSKTKSLPSFSHIPRRLLPSSKKHTLTTTEEPELAEKLPVPFTCQRHLTIHLRRTTQYTVRPNDDLRGKKLEKEDALQSTTPTDSSVDQFLPTSIDLDDSKSGGKPTSSIFEAHVVASTTVETNDGDENHVDDQNKGQRSKGESSSSHASPSVRSSSSTRKLYKRTVSSVNAEDEKVLSLSPSSSSVDRHVTLPLLGSNPFSFLHASAFTANPADGVDENDTEGKSLPWKERPSREFSRRKRQSEIASDMQAAYYLSSSPPSSYPYVGGGDSPTNSSLEKRFHVYRHGCGVKLIQWVDHVSGILFILGFCIIGFVKACFLIILRTEIREMIEKIQILELADPVSPERAHYKDQRLHHVSHPLLAHPHRPSTVSAHAYNAVLLPTIKSPEGPFASSQPTRFTKSYHQRRHSNIVGDRSQNHSQETVNMTLLVTNSQNSRSQIDATKQTEKGRSNPNLTLCSTAVGGGGGCGSGTSGFYMGLGREELFDPTGLSFSVPNTSKYLRRSSTCSSSANPGPSYSLFSHYDSDPKPGPSTRFYHYEPLHHHHHPPYHQQQHCHHQYHPRSRPHIRNISTGAVVHQSSVSSSVTGGDRYSGGGGGGMFSGSGTAVGGGGSACGVSGGVAGGGGGPSGNSSIAFRSFGGESGSGGCSFSSRDENEILSASMENVVVGDGPTEVQKQQSQSSQSEDEKEKERREAEIRDWAAATACTDNTKTVTNNSSISSDPASRSARTTDESTTSALSLGDFSKAGFNQGSDSTGSSSNERTQSTKRNGNNNMDPDSIPLAYLGTAV